MKLPAIASITILTLAAISARAEFADLNVETATVEQASGHESDYRVPLASDDSPLVIGKGFYRSEDSAAERLTLGQALQAMRKKQLKSVSCWDALGLVRMAEAVEWDRRQIGEKATFRDFNPNTHDWRGEVKVDVSTGQDSVGYWIRVVADDPSRNRAFFETFRKSNSRLHDEFFAQNANNIKGLLPGMTCNMKFEPRRYSR